MTDQAVIDDRAPGSAARAIAAARPPQLRRHPVRLAAIARRLYADGQGLTPTEIRREIAARSAGPPPALQTIRNWVIPGEAERQRQLNSETYRRRRQRGGAPMLRSGYLEGDALDERMLELRRHGLSYNTIATILGLYHGAHELNDERVRYRIKRLAARAAEAPPQ